MYLCDWHIQYILVSWRLSGGCVEMALKPDHVASGLTVAAGVYSMVWATSNGMAPPQAGILAMG